MCGRRASLSPGVLCEDDANKLETLLPSMIVCGSIEFKMDKKSYRMIPLANSEDYLYNMAALRKAQEVRVVGSRLEDVVAGERAQL